LSRLKIYKNYDDLFQAYEELNDLKISFQNKMKELKVDCLVLPVQPFPALDHGLGDISGTVIFYTIMFNILDYPAGTIPLGLNKDDSYTSIYNDKSVEVVKKCLKNSINLPVGLQVVTLKGNDEKCLGIIQQLSQLTDKLKNHELSELLNSKSFLLKDGKESCPNIIENFLDTYKLD
jgi:Asp-tRNA(Asn)/Glu-tRNA(Gln) amidotransferase A subunit family amidase